MGIGESRHSNCAKLDSGNAVIADWLLLTPNAIDGNRKGLAIEGELSPPRVRVSR